MKDIYDIIEEFEKRPGQPLALASLVRVVGSSYRRSGARMLICEDGTRAGSLSAGCLEDEVALRAREVLQTGEPIVVSFDTQRRFGCTGRIDIFVERISETFFSHLAQNLAARRSCFVLTVFGQKNRGSRMFGVETNSDFEEEDQLIREIRPPIRLLIVGDGPDNRPFYSIGNLLGWQIAEIFDPAISFFVGVLAAVALTYCASIVR